MTGRGFSEGGSDRTELETGAPSGESSAVCKEAGSVAVSGWVALYKVLLLVAEVGIRSQFSDDW